MPEFLSPGVYPQEVDYTASVRTLSTSTLGLVGVFQKGEVDKPILVTSFEDARNKLGDFVEGQLSLHALKNFFDNGGGRAYVVRVTARDENGDSMAVASSTTLQDRHDTTPANTIEVRAASPGTWGDSLAVVVEPSLAYPTSGFSLIVKQDGAVVERIRDLVMDPASRDYVERKVNETSRFIRVTDLASETAAPENRPAEGEFNLVGGNDAVVGMKVQDFIGSRPNTGLKALDSVDVAFIAIPGEQDEESGPVLAAEMVAYCEGRKDCIAILEVPSNKRTAQDIVEYRDALGIDSSFAALYGPWLEGTHPVTGRRIELPPSGFVAGVYARNDQMGAVWTAPAGPNRGTLQRVIGPVEFLNQADRDVLYEKGVNAIAVVGGQLMIYGQMTLQIRESATNRVNVRRLLAHIQRSVNDSTLRFVFETNNVETWESFKRMVGPFLQRIKDRGGLFDYAVICDERLNTPDLIDRNIMKARILVQPTRSVEFIPLEFAIAPTGADFNEL